jgi:hypothetical protein
MNGYKWQVTNLNAIVTIIIPLLDKYNLNTSKRLNYLKWREVAIYKAKGLHLDKDIANKIVNLKNEMNKSMNWDQKWSFYLLYPIFLTPEWIQGFIDAEGYLGLEINKLKTGNYSTKTTFSISKNTHDIMILQKIKEYFKIGNIKYNTKNFKFIKSFVKSMPNKTEYRVTSAKDCLNIIIPFL